MDEPGGPSGISISTMNPTPASMAASPPHRIRSEDDMKLLPPYPNSPAGNGASQHSPAHHPNWLFQSVLRSWKRVAVTTTLTPTLTPTQNRSRGVKLIPLTIRLGVVARKTA